MYNLLKNYQTVISSAVYHSFPVTTVFLGRVRGNLVSVLITLTLPLVLNRRPQTFVAKFRYVGQIGSTCSDQKNVALSSVCVSFRSIHSGGLFRSIYSGGLFSSKYSGCYLHCYFPSRSLLNAVLRHIIGS